MQKSVLALVTLTTPEGCFLGTTAGRELARKTTESPPPLEGALFSLESINLFFISHLSSTHPFPPPLRRVYAVAR